MGTDFERARICNMLEQMDARLVRIVYLFVMRLM